MWEMVCQMEVQLPTYTNQPNQPGLETILLK